MTFPLLCVRPFAVSLALPRAFGYPAYICAKWHTIQYIVSHHPAGYPEKRYEGSACVAIDGSLISGNGNRICLDLCSPVARPGFLTRQISSQVRQISPDKDGNPDFIGTIQPRHLPYLLNPGLRYVVLTYPETGPYMSRFQRDPSAHSFALGLPPDGPSRFRPPR